MANPYIYISKLDAAKRQLELSIKLFFRNSEPVSIHTLSAASHTLLTDLGKKQGLKSIVKIQIAELIKKEKRKEYLNKVKEAENYFKHADNDFKEQLRFVPATTEFLIFDACYMYQILTKELIPILVLYKMWFSAKHPEIMTKTVEEKETIVKLISDANFNLEDRSKFLEYLPMVEKKLNP